MSATVTPIGRELVEHEPSHLHHSSIKALKRIAFISSNTDRAHASRERLERHYGTAAPECADVIVALGGDGLMLKTLHRHLCDRIPIFGMNVGSIGFLMNEYRENELLERLHVAQLSTIHPLRMVAIDADGQSHEALAINEVSLFRESYRSAKLRISIDGHVRMQELTCDGTLVATPVGSTAYNLSVHGPILPMNAPLLALTPISAFRPRKWRGAVLPNSARIKIEVLEPDQRPVAAVAGHREFSGIHEIAVREMSDVNIELLFDPGHALEERLLREQFAD